MVTRISDTLLSGTFDSFLSSSFNFSVTGFIQMLLTLISHGGGGGGGGGGSFNPQLVAQTFYLAFL